MSEIDISKEAVERLARRIHTREPYKSAVQLMVESISPEPSTIVLGQGDYPTAAQIADRATFDMNLAALSLRALRAALTAAEAERDEALGMAAALRECIGAAIECGMVPKSTAKNGGAASYAHQTHVADMLRSALTDTAAAAREYRARVVEECADIAASATITDHDNLSWTDGRRVAVEAIRAHAAKVREGE